MSDNLGYLSKRKGLKNGLFEQLVESAKKEGGTVSSESLEQIADEFLVGKATTYGSMSFYDFLKRDNANKKVYVCNGSACMLAGTQEALSKELGKTFKKEEIGHICCLGRCHENSAFHYEGRNYSGILGSDVKKVINGKKEPALDSYHVGSTLKQPILTAEFAGVEQYYSNLKENLSKGREKILVELKDSELRGRGGAGFPLGIKLGLCAEQAGEQKFIVCNADEGDPGAFSDRYLLEQQPHSVLFGMIISGFVAGANTGVLYIRKEYPESISTMKQAIQDLESAGFCGANILGTDFSFSFKIIEAAGAYICGEETALLSSIEGQRPEVRVRPPYPAVKGLYNLPTVVSNVETLASVHYILKKGGKAFAKLGTEKSTGTKLVCLDSFFKKPGVYEVEMGTPLSTIVNKLGGGFCKPVKALHVGGPLGGVVPVSKIGELSLDFESFSEAGFLLGHASIVSIPEDYPIVKYVEHLFEFTSVESCGKCFPCRLGAKRGMEMFEQAQAGEYKIDRELLTDLLDTMEEGSLCALGGGLPLGIRNILQYFKYELEPYFREV